MDRSDGEQYHNEARYGSDSEHAKGRPPEVHVNLDTAQHPPVPGLGPKLVLKGQGQRHINSGKHALRGSVELVPAF